VGSSTLNNGMLPTVSGFLTYVKGLRPKNRMGLAFGSYGWGGQGARHVEEALKDMNWEIPHGLINIQYVPDDHELQGVKETGRKLGKIICE